MHYELAVTASNSGMGNGFLLILLYCRSKLREETNGSLIMWLDVSENILKMWVPLQSSNLDEEKEWTYRYEITEKKKLHNNSLKVQPFCHEFWQLLFILACSFLWRRMSSVYLEDGYVWKVVRIIWKLQGPCSSCLFQPNIKQTFMWMLVREMMRGFDCHWETPTSWVHPLFVIYMDHIHFQGKTWVCVCVCVWERERERERERDSLVSPKLARLVPSNCACGLYEIPCSS
jgi:hypothetical protein